MGVKVRVGRERCGRGVCSGTLTTWAVGPGHGAQMEPQDITWCPLCATTTDWDAGTCSHCVHNGTRPHFPGEAVSVASWSHGAQVSSRPLPLAHPRPSRERNQLPTGAGVWTASREAARPPTAPTPTVPLAHTSSLVSVVTNEWGAIWSCLIPFHRLKDGEECK